MTELDVDEILRKVASGDLSPEAAHELLKPTSPDTPGPSGADPAADLLAEPARATAAAPSGAASRSAETGAGSAQPTTGFGAETAQTVRIHASYRSLDVIADPEVSELAVEGKHTVRREGAVTVVETTENPFAGFEPRGGTGPGAKFSFDDLPRGLAWARNNLREQRLTVRVNPGLAVEVDAAGAKLRLSGMTGGTKVRAAGCSVQLEHVRGRLDLDAFTSSVKGSVAITGASRIACESSSVKLELDPGSDVAVTVHNRMGKVVLPQVVSTAGFTDVESATTTLGDGEGRLEIEALMSSVLLTDRAAA